MIVIALIIAVICGLLASLLVRPEKKGLAFALGVLLGPWGVLIAAIMADKEN